MDTNELKNRSCDVFRNSAVDCGENLKWYIGKLREIPFCILTSIGYGHNEGTKIYSSLTSCSFTSLPTEIGLKDHTLGHLKKCTGVNVQNH